MSTDNISNNFRCYFRSRVNTNIFQGENIDPLVTWRWPIVPCDNFQANFPALCSSENVPIRFIRLNGKMYTLAPLRVIPERLMVPPYPGPPPSGTTRFCVGGHRCLDGTLGRHDPRYYPQLLEMDKIWVGYHANPALLEVVTRPEYALLLEQWIPVDGRVDFNVGSWHPEFLDSLFSRRTTVEQQLDSLLLSPGFQQLPTSSLPERDAWTPHEAKEAKIYLDSKDCAGATQRYVAELNAIIEYIQDWQIVERSPTCPQPKAPAKDCFQGCWLIPEIDPPTVTFLMRSAIPTYALLSEEADKPETMAKSQYRLDKENIEYGFDNGERYRETIQQWAQRQGLTSKHLRSVDVGYPLSGNKRFGEFLSLLPRTFLNDGWVICQGHPRLQFPANQSFNVWTIPTWASQDISHSTSMPLPLQPTMLLQPLIKSTNQTHQKHSSMGTEGNKRSSFQIINSNNCTESISSASQQLSFGPPSISSGHRGPRSFSIHTSSGKNNGPRLFPSHPSRQSASSSTVASLKAQTMAPPSPPTPLLPSIGIDGWQEPSPVKGLLSPNDAMTMAIGAHNGDRGYKQRATAFAINSQECWIPGRETKQSFPEREIKQSFPERETKQSLQLLRGRQATLSTRDKVDMWNNGKKAANRLCITDSGHQTPPTRSSRSVRPTPQPAVHEAPTPTILQRTTSELLGEIIRHLQANNQRKQSREALLNSAEAVPRTWRALKVHLRVISEELIKVFPFSMPLPAIFDLTVTGKSDDEHAELLFKAAYNWVLEQRDHVSKAENKIPDSDLHLLPIICQELDPKFILSRLRDPFYSQMESWMMTINDS